MYEQGSFEPVARIVQLASHIEQKRLADIAYETRRFVRIGESEETISQRIADNSKPLINIYHYHCNHLGTPQELTNQDGDVIWLSYDRAWGGSFETIYKPQFIDNFSLDENELGVCQHSCHPYLNQATETSLALTRLDRRTGLRAVG